MGQLKKCWLCGREGYDGFHRHHIFSGSYRANSEKYNAVVFLCGTPCHEFGEFAAHCNDETDKALRKYGQKKVMSEYNMPLEEFIERFGHNYDDEED